MADPVSIPSASEPFVVNGYISRAWMTFLDALANKINEVDDDQTARTAAFIADLAGSKTNDELRDAINNLMGALQTAKLQETS